MSLPVLLFASLMIAPILGCGDLKISYQEQVANESSTSERQAPLALLSELNAKGYHFNRTLTKEEDLPEEIRGQVTVTNLVRICQK